MVTRWIFFSSPSFPETRVFFSFIDDFIMQKVKTIKTNLIVVRNVHEKTQDKVHHDLLLRVCHWMSIPKNVIRMLSKLMSKQETKLEVWENGEKKASHTEFGYLQDDSYSPLNFCLLKYSSVCYYRNLVNRYVKRTFSLFLDDLICIINLHGFLYKDIQNYLKFVNETILQASRHINSKVISVGGYHMMNFFIFHNMKKDQLYQIFKNGV